MVFYVERTSNLNKFGRLKYANTYTTTGTELNAGLTWDVPITDSERDEYAPFTTLVINNKSSERLEIKFNVGSVDTGSNATRVFFLEGLNALIITEDLGLLFYQITIKNTSANNLTAGDVRVNFANFGK